MPDAATRRLHTLLSGWGEADYFGEPLSVLAHGLQAAEIAAERGGDPELVAAALLHDIGHLLGLEAGSLPGMDGCGTPDHEGIGADFLAGLGLPEDTVWLVRRHVDAKRWLCGRSPAYYAGLSEASRTTLRHQGGPMSPEEQARAEADPRWSRVLALRAADEAAKDPTRGAASLERWLMTLRPLISPRAEDAPGAHWLLSREQLRAWDQTGILHLRGALSPDAVAGLGAMADALASLPPGEGPWLVHHERVPDGAVRLCRVENFCHHLPDWGQLCFGLIQDLVGQVWREPARLFKDKLNFKGPGGAGFHAHQDATAYATDELASRHVSALVAIDPATPENGCLEVATGRHREGIFGHEAGVIRPEIAGEMHFQPVIAAPGDIVLFDSYLPHRSASNHSAEARRAAYLTFNPASEGDLHAAYYQKKRQTMRAGAISLNLDFAGEVVD